jgi:hypothetical protein
MRLSPLTPRFWQQYSIGEVMTVRLQFLGVVAVLLIASTARGDGCYMPERAVRLIPEIPAQRALLAWREGVETLVISSALDSPSQSLGWIIPLPSVPTEIEKATPGMLKTLDFCIQPRITHDLYYELKEAILTTFLVNLVVGTFLFNRKQFTALLLLLMIVLILVNLMGTAGGPAGSDKITRAEKVLVETSAIVGSYEIKVLRASKHDDLNAWLDENQFASLPAAAEETIADYISKGWVFATIKLTRAETGLNAPHPIKLVFLSQQPIYPMRLTALAGGSPLVEIYLIADHKALCDPLEVDYCDRFSKTTDNRDETENFFLGDNTENIIGHPMICQLMWDGCIVTKFIGTISAENMKSDIQFNWKPFSAYRRHFYTRQGALEMASSVFAWLAGAWLLISMILYRKRIRKPGGRNYYLALVLLPPIAVFALCGGILLANLPKIDASELRITRHLLLYQSGPCREISSLLDNNPDILQDSEQAIADFLLKNISGDSPDFPGTVTNRVIGGKLLVEDSPGNFTVEKRDGNVEVRIYGGTGAENVLKYDRNGKKMNQD